VISNNTTLPSDLTLTESAKEAIVREKTVAKFSSSGVMQTWNLSTENLTVLHYISMPH